MYTAGWETVHEYVVYVPFVTQLEMARRQGLQTSESLFFRKKPLPGYPFYSSTLRAAEVLFFWNICDLAFSELVNTWKVKLTEFTVKGGIWNSFTVRFET